MTSAPVESFGALLRHGADLLRDGDAARARDEASRALSIRPDDSGARHLLARSLFMLGQLERALVIYEGLLVDDPDSNAVRVNLAVVLLKLGRPSAARPLLEAVVHCAPSHRRAWGYLGVALEQVGLVADAEAALTSGHHVAAARRLRERHPPRPEAPESRRGNTRPAPGTRSSRPASVGVLSCAAIQRFPATLVPLSSQGARGEGGAAPEHAIEIGFEHSVSARDAQRPPPVSAARCPGPVRTPALLDAALKSLLVVPHEITFVMHPTGGAMVRLLEGTDGDQGGLAALSGLVEARSAGLRRAGPGSGLSRGFERFSGSGRVVLAAQRGTRLVRLSLDAGVAAVREDLVAALECALLVGSEDPLGASPRFVRLEGAGAVLLALPCELVAVNVEGDEPMQARSSSIAGWFGALDVEPADDGQMRLFRGEGTVLLARAPGAWD